MLTEGPWMDAKQAALYVGRKSKNAYKHMLRLARTGKIHAGYDGKTFRFQAPDLDSWLYLNAKKEAKR